MQCHFIIDNVVVNLNSSLLYLNYDAIYYSCHQKFQVIFPEIANLKSMFNWEYQNKGFQI